MRRPIAQLPHCRSGARRAPGFTLVELLVSVAMVAVLSVAMGSAVLIASRAIDNGEGSASRAVAAADVVEQMKAELRVATGFVERTPNAVTFTVPDRDGDGVEERIGYAWSGVAGDPLTRAYNDAPETTIAQDVRGFDLTYLLASIDPPASGGGQPGSEVLLLAHHDAPGGQLRTFDIDWEDWCAQYVRPTLPSNATAWSITRVQFMARRDRTPADGVVSVYVTAASSSLTPAQPVLGESRVSESSFASDFAWVEVPFKDLGNLDPAAGVCVLLVYRGGTGDVGVIQYEDGGSPMTPNTHWTTTRNRGYSFSSPTSRQDMLIRVYGTVTTAAAGVQP